MIEKYFIVPSEQEKLIMYYSFSKTIKEQEHRKTRINLLLILAQRRLNGILFLKILIEFQWQRMH
jgi:hypothetical protein